MPAVPYRPHYSIEAYLEWEGDWELWDGVAVSMSPAPNFRHQTIAGNLYFEITTQLRSESCAAGCVAIQESDWHVNDSTVVRPDLMIVCEEPKGQWIENRPEFISEILSPSTRDKDLIAKRDLYAANGVPFYLILDPDNQSAVLLKLDEEGTYREIPSETPFELHPNCTLTVKVASLFARGF